jgi:two-component sensor histidine kinase
MCGFAAASDLREDVAAAPLRAHNSPVVLLDRAQATTAVREAEATIAQLLSEKDELLAERAMLLQEMQHRIGNSLQIIASVLRLKARAADLPETRAQLQDAHDRVMAVAAVQRHLQGGVGEVDLAPYLTELCASLGASMIRELRPLTLDVRAEPATVSSRDATSLGLVVTELVINALKHAFPEGRGGAVVIAYSVRPGGWTLSVSDDGVGRGPPSPAARVGLGSSVVEALARQLGARVEIAGPGPGARTALVSLEPR